MKMTLAAATLALAVSPALAGPCEDMDAAQISLEPARARMISACDTDTTLTGPCSQAIIADRKAIELLGEKIEQCTAALDRANSALNGGDSLVTWSYDPPPPWRPE